MEKKEIKYARREPVMYSVTRFYAPPQLEDDAAPRREEEPVEERADA